MKASGPPNLNCDQFWTNLERFRSHFRQILEALGAILDRFWRLWAPFCNDFGCSEPQKEENGQGLPCQHCIWGVLKTILFEIQPKCHKLQDRASGCSGAFVRPLACKQWHASNGMQAMACKQWHASNGMQAPSSLNYTLNFAHQRHTGSLP